MVKLYKPRRIGNWENVLAYSGEEEDSDELSDDANASDSTLVVSPNNPCLTCHLDAHQSRTSEFRFSIGPRVGIGASTSTDLSREAGHRTTSTVGVEALIGISYSITHDRRAGTPAMPTIVVAEPDNTRVDSTRDL